VVVLYFYVQIDSHASRTPLSVSKFGRGHASRGRLSYLPSVTWGPNLPEKCEKANFRLENRKFLLVSRQFFAGVEMSNRLNGSHITPRVNLNVKIQ
jgi:hypothetical protein